MKKIVLCLTIVALLVAANASAENFTVGVGPVGNIFVVDTRPELNPGIGGQFFFDYRWSPQISTQFSVIVTTQNGKGISSGDDSIIFFGIPSIDLKYYLMSNESHWDPYLMVGVGFYLVSEGSQNNGSQGVGIGANAGLGCDYFLSEKWSVGASGSFRSIGLITSTTGSNNGTAVFPFTMTGYVGFHF